MVIYLFIGQYVPYYDFFIFHYNNLNTFQLIYVLKMSNLSELEKFEQHLQSLINNDTISTINQVKVEEPIQQQTHTPKPTLSNPKTSRRGMAIREHGHPYKYRSSK